MEKEQINRRELIERIKREISANTYKVKSSELAEKISQRLKEDIPAVGGSRRI